MSRIRMLSLAVGLVVVGWTVAPGDATLAGTSVETREAPRQSLPRIRITDNDAPAGKLSDGRLELELEIREGLWHLLGEDQPPGRVLAFAERGRAPSIPGPLVRVEQGTEIHVTVTNPLDTTVVIRGLSSRRNGLDAPLRLEPGDTRQVRFEADVPGTYFYWGATEGTRLNRRAFEDSQLSGALVVDPPGKTADDRILMMGMWVDGRRPNGAPDFGREFLVINGRPWPHTERFTYAMGDSVRWRLINASFDTHSMHLHGFYYRIDARGDIARDTIYWPEERRTVVTEDIGSGRTMSIAWSPDRPGGWIFHCHMSIHVVPNPSMTERLTAEERFEPMFRDGHAHGDADNHAEEGMGGLLLAMYVEPPDGWVPNEPKRRELRLFVQSAAADGGPSGRQFAYVLQEGDVEPTPDSVRLPGSPIILRKGEPTAITVTNRTDEPTQVHWHGLEIESYYDGVAGFGGYPNRLTPAIEPGESWEMRITPPRAGSFMYHTHVNDLRQQSSGLYGAFIVLEEDEEWDPATDRLFVFGESPFRDDGIPVLNGANPTEPITFEVGTTYRLRFMQITLNRPATRVRLVKDGFPVRWTPMAADGFDLPAVQRRPALADQTIAVGQTFDYEYTASEAGKLRVELRTGGGDLLVEQIVDVLRAGD